MHVNDLIIGVLTPGSPFNEKNKLWRSAATLSAFTGLALPDLMGLFQGDLAGKVSLKVSTKKKGVMVALKELIPAAPAPAIKVAAGNAHIQPAMIANAEAAIEQSVAHIAAVDAAMNAPQVQVQIKPPHVKVVGYVKTGGVNIPMHGVVPDGNEMIYGNQIAVDVENEPKAAQKAAGFAVVYGDAHAQAPMALDVEDDEEDFEDEDDFEDEEDDL